MARAARPPGTVRGAGVAGVLSGALTTSISVSGPPIVLWLEALELRPAELRASLAASFLFMNVAGGIVVVAAGGTGAVRLDVLAPLLVLVLVGHALGLLVFRRIAGPAFSLVALGLVMCAGMASLVAGVAGAWGGSGPGPPHPRRCRPVRALRTRHAAVTTPGVRGELCHRMDVQNGAPPEVRVGRPPGAIALA